MADPLRRVRFSLDEVCDTTLEEDEQIREEYHREARQQEQEEAEYQEYLEREYKERMIEEKRRAAEERREELQRRLDIAIAQRERRNQDARRERRPLLFNANLEDLPDEDF